MFNFCKPVSSKKRFLPFRKLDDHFSFSLFDKADAIPRQEWEKITGGQTIFLEPAYLQIAERGHYAQLSCRYVTVYFKGAICGILYFQIVDFKAGVVGDLFSQQTESQRSKRMSLFEKYIDSNKEEVLLRLFTCGNNLVSGEYGYLFDHKIEETVGHNLLLKITDLISKEEKLKGALSAILLKDFYAPLEPEQPFKDEKYSRFLVEPNLIVTIPPNVHSIDDYIALFSKKYRNRAKSIFKDLSGVEVRDFSLQEIKDREAEIYELYEEVFDKAKFKLIKLPSDYFSSVKEAFQDLFLVKGFFQDQRLIAFCSSFLMPDGSVEAHYIGIHYALNQSLNLYQNILYVILQEAIRTQRSTVNLGRTAAEIKTTVGAKAKDLVCYLKPQNTISRWIQRPFISFLQPAEWIPRNPFKEELEPGAKTL